MALPTMAASAPSVASVRSCSMLAMPPEATMRTSSPEAVASATMAATVADALAEPAAAGASVVAIGADASHLRAAAGAAVAGDAARCPLSVALDLAAAAAPRASDADALRLYVKGRERVSGSKVPSCEPSFLSQPQFE